MEKEGKGLGRDEKGMGMDRKGQGGRVALHFGTSSVPKVSKIGLPLYHFIDFTNFNVC